jgi:purine-nucleoside phosphorylase
MTAEQLRKLTSLRPSLAFVLGSGFSEAVSRMKIETKVSFGRLRGFPPAKVSGHAGEVVFGHLGGTPTVALRGRAHYYEGHSLASIAFPVRVLAAFGVRTLLLTNAAGGISRRLRPGEFMRLRDHINFMGANPLREPHGDAKNRFVDMSAAYDRLLNRLLAKAARQTSVRMHSGVYLAVSGPSYETPAEIRAFARLGADAVGMSTVPEAIVARQCGLKVAALSCITNLAAGRSQRRISHEEVLAVGEQVKVQAARLLEKFAEFYTECFDHK